MYGVSVSVGARPSPRLARHHSAAAGGLASRGTLLINLAMVAVAVWGGWWAGATGRVVLADAHCVMDVWPAALRSSDARSIRTGDAEALEERGSGGAGTGH